MGPRRPLVCSHGTDADFTTFDISHFGKTDFGAHGRGFYFAPNDWGGLPGKNKIKAYLDVKNPIYVDGEKNLLMSLALCPLLS